MSKVLITGSNGFVGQALAKYLQACSKEPAQEPDKVHQYEVVYTYRRLAPEFKHSNKHFAVGNIDVGTQWQKALSGVDAIVHLAARVHVMNETRSDPLSAFRSVNTNGTLNLARQAVDAGVRRFVYISSIKVNGEQTDGIPFTAEDTPNPLDPYAVSKYEAEQQLMALAKETGLEVVIIRPPLVYGPGVKGNFFTMMKWIAKGIPLPLGKINNKRSLLALDNLVSFITRCIEHPKAANEIFLISDNEDVSTTRLLKKVAKAMNKNSRLIPLPVSWMVLVAGLLGKKAVTDRLFGSLQVDSSKAQTLLDWQPVISMDEQLLKMVRS